MIRVLVADEIDLAGIKKLPAKKFTVTCKFGIPNEDIIGLYNEYDVLVIRTIRKIDDNFINHTKFRVIATCSKGTDHIDLKTAGKKGIKILNAEDSNHISAAEHTLGLILTIFKKINLSDRLVREGNFSNYHLKEMSFTEKT